MMSTQTPTNALSWKAPTFPAMTASECRAASAGSHSEHEDTILPEDYRPTKYDVINGRGKKSYNHVGNRRFRQLTAMNLKRYQNAKCKVDKTVVVIGIVNCIRKASPSGGFIKKCPNTGRWISMSDEGAREKVGHCLRDMIANKRDEAKSSNSNNNKSSSSSNAEERIRNISLQNNNQKSTYSSNNSNNSNNNNRRNNTSGGSAGGGFGRTKRDPPTMVVPVMPIPAVHPNFASAIHGSSSTSNTTASTTRRSSRSPKNSPKRSKAVSNQAARMAHSGGHMNVGGVGASSRARANTAGGVAAMPQITSTFNNFDYLAVTKGNSQEMSLQQRKILQLLEGGFKGTVEDVLRAVGSP